MSAPARRSANGQRAVGSLVEKGTSAAKWAADSVSSAAGSVTDRVAGSPTDGADDAKGMLARGQQQASDMMAKGREQAGDMLAKGKEQGQRALQQAQDLIEQGRDRLSNSRRSPGSPSRASRIWRDRSRCLASAFAAASCGQLPLVFFLRRRQAEGMAQDLAHFLFHRAAVFSRADPKLPLERIVDAADGELAHDACNVGNACIACNAYKGVVGIREETA